MRRYAASKINLELPDGKRREISSSVNWAARSTRCAWRLSCTTRKTERARCSAATAANTARAAIVLPVPVTLDRERAEKALLTLKDELDRLPVDARLDLEARKLVPEQNGRLLDIDATLGAIEEALARGEPKAKVVFEERAPKRIGSELGAVQFDEILGYFETHYDRSVEVFGRAATTCGSQPLSSTGHVLLPGRNLRFQRHRRPAR